MTDISDIPSLKQAHTDPATIVELRLPVNYVDALLEMVKAQTANNAKYDKQVIDDIYKSLEFERNAYNHQV